MVSSINVSVSNITEQLMEGFLENFRMCRKPHIDKGFLGGILCERVGGNSAI